LHTCAIAPSGTLVELQPKFGAIVLNREQLGFPWTGSGLVHISQLFIYVNSASVFKLGVNITKTQEKIWVNITKICPDFVSPPNPLFWKYRKCILTHF